MLDGRHTGTGGGNHFVLGGATPADSPFLRRPDLLRSLSLLAQSPVAVVSVLRAVHRTDEPGAARRRSPPRRVYELEIAFAQFRAGAGRQRAAVAGRSRFRHLLVDVTGNTHRAEFCIDKLYSPDSPTGRRAARVARLRDAAACADEPRAATAAARARRALLARAVRGALVRWGTTLHDRFMLPHFVWQDFADVIEELGARAMARRRLVRCRISSSASRWPVSCRCAASHSRCARRSSRGTCSARKAAVGTTVRYVDSSVERLQVNVSGLIDDRFVVTCNGRARAAAADRAQRRVRRRRAISRVAAASACIRRSPSTRRSRSTRRHLDAALARRMPVSRDPSRRLQLRHSRSTLRGREPPPARFFRAGSHAGPMTACRPAACGFPYTLDLRT